MSNAKNVLKSLVKECLVELLQEGISLSSGERNSNKFQSQMLESRPKNENRQVQRNKNQILESKPSKNIESIISSIADNDLMKSILADTASTTLVEQTKHDRANLTNNSLPQFDSQEGPGVDLDSVFSDSKNNWSVMAFGKAKK
jgi:hypothetical protein